MAAFCLFTLYFWPESLNLEWLQYIIVLALVSYFIYQITLLKKFKLMFTLYSDNRLKYSGDSTGYSCQVLWVSPLLCAFYVSASETPERVQPESKLLIIWRDMLSDSNYRHLSRLLLLIRRG